MLDNLVESKNNSRGARKLYGFLFSTFLVVATILLSATVWSLFAKDFVMGNEDMELSNLVNPIPVAETKPEIVPVKPKQQNEPQTAKSELPNRQNIIARIDEPQIAPDKVSTAPNSFKSRPNSPFTNNRNKAETDGCSSCGSGRNTDNAAPGFVKPENQSTVADIVKPKIPTPPPALEKPKTEKKPAQVTLGVINGRASNLPIPPYPAPARAAGASGAVNVQVTIDEQGSVISAKAVSGHPLLRQAAENAARKARFTPTLLSNIPVKVNGLIVYNFTK